MTGPVTSRGKRTDTLWAAYKLRWNRRRLLLRSWRKRRQLTTAVDRTAQIKSADILGFACVRNEETRLPFWLKHHRGLGVRHFLIVANDCSDGTVAYLTKQADVSLWTTDDSYRMSRFGMDWLGVLHRRYGADHWCLTLDADELFIYPRHDTRPLDQLTAHLDRSGVRSFGATMIDLYPMGRLSDVTYSAGDDPTGALGWFDAFPYWVQRQPKLHNLWLQGGPRARTFFSDQPDRAPTLNKVPLVRWSRGYTYVSSMHTMLPRALNHTYDTATAVRMTGALLHTKFLDQIIEKSAEELSRREHFGQPQDYDPYYKAIIADPVLWTEQSCPWQGWQDLAERGIIEAGDWATDPAE